MKTLTIETGRFYDKKQEIVCTEVIRDMNTSVFNCVDESRGMKFHVEILNWSESEEEIKRDILSNYDAGIYTDGLLSVDTIIAKLGEKIKENSNDINQAVAEQRPQAVNELRSNHSQLVNQRRNVQLAQFDGQKQKFMDWSLSQFNLDVYRPSERQLERWWRFFILESVKENMPLTTTFDEMFNDWCITDLFGEFWHE